ncbi:copper amine oxidase N-terminal domain-containing protein [Paenibacillus sp. FSL H7-0350]|uniref:copper amine oxidase N-terminal domain-containing protein n=1 Tax=Paenibacillus sp. FSL H7-0350 TaxID=2975345 RepID=UPI0031598CE9
MRSIRLRFGSAILAIIMLLGLVASVASAAQVTVTVQVNGTALKFPDAKPYYENNRVMIPIRFVSEALGAKVGYGLDRSVTIELGTKKILMKINSDTVTVESVIQKLDVPARLQQNRTYVPLRFVSEALGAEVGWNQEKRLVMIKTKVSSTPEASPSPSASPAPGGENMFKVGFEWPRETELGKELFVDNMKVVSGKLTFTMPKIAESGSKYANDGSSVPLIPGKTYSFAIGKGAGFISISKPESNGDSWEGYNITLDTNFNEDLSALFGKITGDVIVFGNGNSASPLSEVLGKAKSLK